MVSVKFHHQSEAGLQDHVNAAGGDGGAGNEPFNGCPNTLAIDLAVKSRGAKVRRGTGSRNTPSCRQLPSPGKPIAQPHGSRQLRQHHAGTAGNRLAPTDPRTRPKGLPVVQSLPLPCPPPGWPQRLLTSTRLPFCSVTETPATSTVTWRR